MKFKVLISLFVLFIYGCDIETKVHVFGDSHAYFSFSNVAMRGHFDENSVFCLSEYDQTFCTEFNIHHMGPITMHRIGRDGLGVLNIHGIVHEGDTVVFVFGEIDVRCHIGKQRDIGERTVDEIIDTLVTRYFATINQNIEAYKDINAVVMAPVPPSDNGHTSLFPVYGPIDDRIAINNILASRLKKACIEHSVHLLDVRDIFSAKTGELAYELSDGIVHVGLPHNRIIIEKLLKLITKQD